MKVNIFGPCLGTSGWAQHTRQFSAALAQFDEVVVVPWDAPPEGVGALAPRADADIGIGIGPIERMVDVVGQCRVGFMVWETTVVPDAKLRILSTLDEVWTPSEWGRVVLLQNGLSEDRVHVVPEGVDPFFFRSLRHVQDDARRPFRFLCVAKWEVRKGIADLALAFAREFGPAERAELILHCFNPYLQGFDIRLALERLKLPPHAPIRTSNPLPLPGLLALYNACDVLVQPTKAEGWGLPIIEALACGVPAIATNYSGHTAFLNDDNGYLLDVARMIPVDDPFFYGAGEPLGVWAQPDLDHLRHLMRRAFENAAEQRDKGLQARRDVTQRWTWQDAARIAHQRLQAR